MKCFTKSVHGGMYFSSAVLRDKEKRFLERKILVNLRETLEQSCLTFEAQSIVLSVDKLKIHKAHSRYLVCSLILLVFRKLSQLPWSTLLQVTHDFT